VWFPEGETIMARRRTRMPSFCSSGTSHLTFSSPIRRQQPSQLWKLGYRDLIPAALMIRAAFSLSLTTKCANSG
jgi:hypothetical protein